MLKTQSFHTKSNCVNYFIKQQQNQLSLGLEQNSDSPQCNSPMHDIPGYKFEFAQQEETGKCDLISREKWFNWEQFGDDSSKVLELEDKDCKYNYTWGIKEKYAGSERRAKKSQLRNLNDKNMNYMEILEAKEKLQYLTLKIQWIDLLLEWK